MTPQEIATALARLEPWFHCIDLGGGLKTKTASVMGEPIEHPEPTWQLVRQCLPADLRGKSLLDVGCNAGFYSVEAKRRGAKRVLGVDAQRKHIRQALFVRKVLDLDIEYRRMDVYELDPCVIGEFDITLALGLVYHLKHLVLGLEKLYGVTRELLIVETAIIPPEQTPQSFVQTLGRFEQTLHPLACVANSGAGPEAVFNWFLPSPAALKTLLENTGFDDVTIAHVTADRAVLVCRKQTQRERNFAALLTLKEGPAKSRTETELRFRLRLENSGGKTWSASGSGDRGHGAVQLGAHLLRADEEEVSWDYGRAPLSHDVHPGEITELEIRLQAPVTAGSYIVEFDMVEEQRAWFEDYGSRTVRHTLSVE
jgi:tRNA (mo5U34)-methyltransferase